MKISKSEVIAGLIVFIIVTFISSSIAYILNQFGFYNGQELFIPFLASVVLILILVFSFWRKFTSYCLNFLIRLVFSSIDNSDKMFLGFVKIYKNYNDAKEDIEEDFKSAKEIKLFIQIGRRLLVGKDSLFFELFKQKGADSRIHIIYTKKDSKYLDRDRLGKRGTNYGELIGSLNQVEESIKMFKEMNIKIEDRRHDEPYLWRIMIFDQTAYFHPYFFNSENDDLNAPILKFKHSERSFYNILFLFFEHIWDKNISVN